MITFLLLWLIGTFAVVTLFADAYVLWLHPELVTEAIWWIIACNVVVVAGCQIGAWQLNHEKKLLTQEYRERLASMNRR